MSFLNSTQVRNSQEVVDDRPSPPGKINRDHPEFAVLLRLFKARPIC